MIAASRLTSLATAAVVALAGCATSRTRTSRDDARHGVVLDRGRSTYERRSDAPNVRVWLSGGDGTYHAGDRVRALFRTEDDGYVTVIRIDTDGRLRILFPRAPYEDNWVRAGHTYRVPGGGNATFAVDDPTGVGYVFAISSYEPFDFGRVSYRRGWDHRAAGDPVRGDPFLAVRRLADLIAFDDRTGYATAYDEYYVGRRVAYPRYACYDCHGSNRIPVDDPYGHPCPRYRVVVYDDSYYYPYRYYPGTRVVYSPRSRYEFKEIATRGPIPGGPTPGGIGRGTGAPNDAGSAGVEHRRRVDDVDLRRPNSPTTDPNLGSSAAARGSAGATRPGDDLPTSAGSERRRPDDGSVEPQPVREGLRTPRRDGETTARPTPHEPGTPPPARPDGDDDRPGRAGGGPRREPGGSTRGEDNAQRDVGARERAPDRRVDPPREERREERGEERREQRAPSPPEPRGETRRDEPAAERRPDSPSREAPREDARRDQPSREEARRETPKREESRAESRREERRPEAKSDSRRDDRRGEGARRRTPE